MKDESPHVSIDRLDIRIRQFEEQLDAIRMMTAEEAASAYVEFREIFDYIDAVRDKWASVKDRLAKEIIPGVFERSNIDGSIKLKSGHRVTISVKTLASMTDKTAGMKWLQENGLADVIQPTVNASTLSAVARTLMEENKSLPNEYFNVVLQPNASVTKAK